MISAHEATQLFQDSIRLWHTHEEQAINPYPGESYSYFLFYKNQIDSTQWHKEDEIRRIDLDSHSFVGLKREIDALNQMRTNIVEKLDDIFFEYYALFPVLKGARLNSESPAWMLDRMSILELKIFHMQEQVDRKEISTEFKDLNQSKLDILLEQRKDLCQCFDEILNSRMAGEVYFKVYRQMKMYNDPNLNPSLYKNKESTE